MSLRGIMGKLIVSLFLLEQDTVQSVFWLWWRMLKPYTWSPVRHKQKQTLIPPFFPPSLSISLSLSPQEVHAAEVRKNKELHTELSG